MGFIEGYFKKFLMFCFVGGTAALIYLTIFNFFRFWVGISFFISLVLAISISIVYNFFMNRNITFSARGHPIKKQLPRYVIVYGLSIGVNIITTLTIETILGIGVLQENIAAIGGIALSIPVSFFGSLLWAFKNPNGIFKLQKLRVSESCQNLSILKPQNLEKQSFSGPGNP